MSIIFTTNDGHSSSAKAELHLGSTVSDIRSDTDTRDHYIWRFCCGPMDGGRIWDKPA